MGRIAGMTAEETRARLIEAASRSFAERGYDGTRIAQIAREAGLSSGAIYAHYRSKAELLLASLQARTRGEIAGLVRSDMRADLVSTVVALGSRLDVPDDRDSGLLIEAIVASRRDTELRSLLADGMDGRERFLADLISVSQRDGATVGDVSPEVAARFLLMVRLGSKLLGLLRLPPLNEDDWRAFIDRLVDVIRRPSSEPVVDGASTA
ncbi:MAG TPA: helix-turn-helix domain-containing protein [Acidimicrobiales bacterium]|nr:helix-turn-helix domain-containing protein [Acidimicrobiales bacterium]